MVDKRKIAIWQVAAVFGVTLLASLGHFAFELSGFWYPMTFFGSVNESTYEHLKIFFWGGLIWAAIQHPYTKEYTNNYWAAKTLALAVTPLGIITSFYFYLGIWLPLYGKGTLTLDILTGVFGVGLGEWLAYRWMIREPFRPAIKKRAVALLAVLVVAAPLLTYFPPRIFLFENFWGYTYSGDFGVLDDYGPYLVFSERSSPAGG